jgi:ABC-type dipeptide/oligopeptide/nickel transport system ATPase component
VRIPLPLKGNLADARNPLPGCRLHERYPIAVQRYRFEIPRLLEISPGHRAACHLI